MAANPIKDVVVIGGPNGAGKTPARVLRFCCTKRRNGD